MTANQDGGEKAAAAVARGTSRLLAQMGFHCLGEFTLKTGRRVDLIGLNRQGRIVIVEIKVSLADFRADQKWHEYLDHGDGFYFAIPPELPPEAFVGAAAQPERTGLIVADRFAGTVLREPAWTPLAAARRRQLTTDFAHAAAGRLHRLLDPDGVVRLAPL